MTCKGGVRLTVLITPKPGYFRKVILTCEPVDAKSNPEVILNVRCQNGYFYQ